MSTPRELARTIAEIVNNARKVRGKKFADVLVIMTNFYTILQILGHTGAPKGVMKLVTNVLEHTTTSLYHAVNMTEEECEEISSLMDTITDQAAKLTEDE